jgi:hypothetical protein
VLPPVVIVTKPETVPQPGTPSEPGAPSEPGTPSTPGTPSEPGTPAEPGTPSTPSTPPPSSGGSSTPLVFYGVKYEVNGGTGAAAPVDGTAYPSGATVTVENKPEDLVKEVEDEGAYAFTGWNTKADGTGTHYNGGATFSISSYTILYAEWVINTITALEITGIYGPDGDAERIPVSEIDTEQYIGRVVWAPWNSPESVLGEDDPFASGVGYTATITLEPNVGWTLNGITEEDYFTVVGAGEATYDDGVITAVFPGIRADVPSDLGTAITTAKGYYTANGSEATIYLSEAFYKAATSVIVIDPPEARNGTPYTIKGLGTEGGDTPLTVGIHLANDNVTLAWVKMVVPDDKKVKATADYWAALYIGNDDADENPANDKGSHNVTVRNCNIDFTATADMAAGIFVAGVASGGISEGIVIKDTKVTVRNSSGSATQAIALKRTGASFTITGNTLSATNTNLGNTDTPASALLISLNHDKFIEGSDMPTVSGNFLRGYDFDFYVNILDITDLVGVDDLRTNKFGTIDTEWATSEDNTTSKYKKLLNALLPDALGAPLNNGGFGRFGLYLNNGERLVLEYYEINNGKIEAINYWGPSISENTYNDSDYDNTAENVEIYTTGTTRGRKALIEEEVENTTFNWKRGVPGENVNLPPS